jgi:hypothetical protein
VCPSPPCTPAQHSAPHGCAFGTGWLGERMRECLISALFRSRCVDTECVLRSCKWWEGLRLRFWFGSSDRYHCG